MLFFVDQILHCIITNISNSRKRVSYSNANNNMPKNIENTLNMQKLYLNLIINNEMLNIPGDILYCRF